MYKKIKPGNGGRDCPHNGYGKKECACDECDWFLCCFPEYGRNKEYGFCQNCDNYCPRNRKSFAQKIKEKFSR